MASNDSTNKKGFLSKAKNRITTAFFSLFMVLTMTGGASASVLDVTNITAVFTDLTGIFPAIGNFVIAVLPTLIMLAVVGFVLGFFDKILGIFDRVF